MSAVNFSEAEFYLNQRRRDNQWKAAAAIAAAIHLCLFISSFYLPDFIKRDPLLDQAITVDLVSMPEPVVAQQPTQPEPVVEPGPSQPEAPPPAEPVNTAVVIPAETKVEPPPEVAAKPISVRPLKRKKKKAVDTRLAEEKERERRTARLREQIHRQQQREKLERERRKIEAEALRAQREAEKAAVEARKALAEMYRRQMDIQQATAATGSRSGSNGRRQVQSIVEKQYYSALYQQVQSFWVLPEVKKWDPGLEAVVVLRINRDGTVLDTKIEKRSKDAFFDQLVIKTINNASPMPRFPKLMKESEVEVGLRFRPGQLEM